LLDASRFLALHLADNGGI